MDKDKKFIWYAIEKCRSVEKFGNARVYSVLVHRNTIISEGSNHNPKTHPAAKLFGKNRHALYPHAELYTILMAERDGFTKFDRSTLYVARITFNHRGQYFPAIAQPCNGCTEAILNYNIPKVVWTASKNKFARSYYNNI